jgi:urease accessory protein
MRVGLRAARRQGSVAVGETRMTAPAPVAPAALATIHQRSHGRATAGFVHSGGRMRLARLEQVGSAKAFVLDGDQVVFLNTSGGLTGGDRLAFVIEVPASGRVTGTTQTAERVYRAGEGRARIDVAARVGAGGHLDWLPQETILFDRSAAIRRTVIDLDPGASVLAVETLVLGRAAMGETVRAVDFRDTRLIRRAGRPVHLEPLHLGTDRLGPRAALLASARAAASVVLIAPGAADALDPVRAILTEPGVSAAASAPETHDGARLTVRLMAAEAWPLRRQLVRLLTLLRRAPPPRVWQT